MSWQWLVEVVELVVAIRMQAPLEVETRCVIATWGYMPEYRSICNA